MSIQEEDDESDPPKYNERGYLDTPHRFINELLASLGGFKDEQDGSL